MTPIICKDEEFLLMTFSVISSPTFLIINAMHQNNGINETTDIEMFYRSILDNSHRISTTSN